MAAQVEQIGLTQPQQQRGHRQHRDRQHERAADRLQFRDDASSSECLAYQRAHLRRRLERERALRERAAGIERQRRGSGS